MRRADSPWPFSTSPGWSPFPTQADDRSPDFPPGMKTPNSKLIFRIKQRMAGMNPLNASSAYNAAWAPGAFGGSPNPFDDASALPHVGRTPTPHPLGPPPALARPPAPPSEDTPRRSRRAAAAAAAEALGTPSVLGFGSPPVFVDDPSTRPHVRVHPLCYCGFLVLNTVI
jgi:hypothetical protein